MIWITAEDVILIHSRIIEKSGELTACGIDLVLKRQLRRLFNHLAERIFIPLTLKRLHGLDMG